MKLSLSALVLLLLLAVPASAQQDWASIASAGTVDPTSAPYAYGGPSIRFAGAAVGTIVARYNVTNTFGSAINKIVAWNTLRAAIDDNSPNAWVRVRLVQVDRCSNFETTLCGFGSADVAGTQCPTCPFAGPLDFGNFEYYVEVTMWRNAAVAWPAVHAVTVF